MSTTSTTNIPHTTNKSINIQSNQQSINQPTSEATNNQSINQPPDNRRSNSVGSPFDLSLRAPQPHGTETRYHRPVEPQFSRWVGEEHHRVELKVIVVRAPRIGTVFDKGFNQVPDHQRCKRGEQQQGEVSMAAIREATAASYQKLKICPNRNHLSNVTIAGGNCKVQEPALNTKVRWRHDKAVAARDVGRAVPFTAQAKPKKILNLACWLVTKHVLHDVC